MRRRALQNPEHAIIYHRGREAEAEPTFLCWRFPEEELSQYIRSISMAKRDGICQFSRSRCAFDPDELTNPDTDMRYAVADLIVERSLGALVDNGWTYEGEKPCMLVFLKATDIDAGPQTVLDVVKSERVMGNDLSTASVVAIREPGSQANVQNNESYEGFKVIYPIDFKGKFAPWVD